MPDGIRPNYPVTLKSKLKFTQGHWKVETEPLNRYYTTYY